MVVPLLLALLAPLLATAQPDFTDLGPLLKVPDPASRLFFNPQPVVAEGAVLAPLSVIERWLGVKAEGDRRGEFALAYGGEAQNPVRMRLWVGQRRALIAQAEVPLDVAPRLIGDETFVPLRFVAEAVGTWVEPSGRSIVLRKPDEGWECQLAIPPHPQSLEGKLAALAVARRPDVPKRIESLALSADTLSGELIIAEPASTASGVKRLLVRCRRDGTGWHFVSEGLAP